MRAERLSNRSSRLGAVAAIACTFLLFASSQLAADTPIVFASRQLDANPDSSARATAIERARSGKLLVRGADGTIRTLVDARLAGAPADTPTDVMDPDVSWDAQHVVFAGYSPVESAWRIYEVAASGGPHAGLRRITRSDRTLDLAPLGAAGPFVRDYDDVDPCYLPDGRVCFVSTRYPAIAPDGRGRGTNLYVVRSDGSETHRITSERFGADTPTIDLETGKIVYSRWWRSTQFQIDPSGEDEPTDPGVDPGSPGYADILPPPLDGEPLSAIRDEVSDDEFPGLNSWFLASIKPDGTEMAMFSGTGLDRQSTQAWRPSFDANGSFLALFIPRTPFLGLPRGDGLRIVRQGAVDPVPLGGPQTFSGDDAVGFVYASAEKLPDGRLLVAAARKTDAASVVTDYDIFVQSGDGAPEPFHAALGTSETGAVPLAVRPVPPVLADGPARRLPDQPPRSVEEAFELGGSFVFSVENIFGNAPVDVPIATAPPAVDGLTIEFFMNPQRTGTSVADDPILIASRAIGPSGRVEVELPGGVPLFEVLRTPSGDIPMGRDGQIFHVGGHNFGVENQAARCIGCHTGHSMLEVPEDAAWTNLAPSAEVIASSTRRVSTAGVTVLQRPENLVDRRTGALRTEWSAQTRSASLEFAWPQPLRAREVILRGTAAGTGTVGPRDQLLSGLRLIFLQGSDRVREVVVGEAIAASGTRVAVDDGDVFDRLQVVIREADVSGRYEGHDGPALAEVEVIARVFEPATDVAFVRGDGNCDGILEITDAVLLLDWLFRGSRLACCRAAFDTDANDRREITDAVYLLSFLFQGGPAPAAPFPSCAPAPVGDAGCDGPSVCF